MFTRSQLYDHYKKQNHSNKLVDKTSRPLDSYSDKYLRLKVQVLPKYLREEATTIVRYPRTLDDANCPFCKIIWKDIPQTIDISTCPLCHAFLNYHYDYYHYHCFQQRCLGSKPYPVAVGDTEEKQEARRQKILQRQLEKQERVSLQKYEDKMLVKSRKEDAKLFGKEDSL